MRNPRGEGILKSMSKPKGRRKPLHSEITSLRHSTDAEEGPVSAPEAVPTEDSEPVGDPSADPAEPDPSLEPSDREPLSDSAAEAEPSLADTEEPQTEEVALEPTGL